MIKNIVFDMGGVLIHFTPREFIARCTDNTEDAALLLREVFQSLEWAKLDRGSLCEAQAENTICARLPARLHPIAHRLICEWDALHTPIPGMAQLVGELKAKGYHLYLLSNAARRQHEYWPSVAGHEHFDGTLISADWKLVKPQPEIYRALFATFGLQPHECLFIDDSIQNVEGADYVGMPGIVFHGDAQELRTELERRGIL